MRECRLRQVVLFSTMVTFLIVAYVFIRHTCRERDDGAPISREHYEFVVSHYNENLDWLRPLANRSHVYHKGGDTAPPFPVRNWERLPNVGREGHTYLHHIIYNYDNLTDLTVFLQGHGLSPSDAWCFASPMDFVRKATEGRYCKVVGTLDDWGPIKFDSKWKKAFDTGNMRKGRVGTTGEFYKAVFGAPPPASAPLCYTACFSATRENLKRYPRTLYERAISYLDDHPNPEEGHLMERLWSTVINANMI